MAGIQSAPTDFLRPVADEGYIRAPDFAKRRPDGAVVLVKIEGAHAAGRALPRRQSLCAIPQVGRRAHWRMALIAPEKPARGIIKFHKTSYANLRNC
ncbi:hypothetical protein MPC4_110002 [Methylocella tundrae]|uniref:Uncharacterized protein n=1 Tax=Methylocella tundrae TaxID=227605 RepID=A0A8B6M3J9_METTU|nr:hypothetical protein MPC1_14400001 [Methylocella tundrae]VTZ48702.1 hypothetical protein MPC4_110002 [Methylocella tundrae]